MSVETIVNDVKSRADVVVTRGQEALEAGVETLKAANTIVVEGVQELVQTNVSAGKELSTLVQASVSKVKTDGIKAVASNPIAYLPEGKATVVGAYSESIKIVSKTGDELAKTLKSGVETISAKIQGQAPVVVKAKKAATKTVSKAKKAAKKVAA
ncbi:MAG: phasin family protein [Solimonas sp.]